MLIILDSNEYIFSFGLHKKPFATTLLEKLVETFPQNIIRIPRTIAKEVKRNISDQEFKEFILFIHTLTKIDEDIVVPFELVFKYEMIDLKPTDAFIAAYADFIHADILVSENRHFLSRHNLSFKVLTAEKFLKI